MASAQEGPVLVQWDFGVAASPTWRPTVQAPGVRADGPQVNVAWVPWLSSAWPLYPKAVQAANRDGAQAAGLSLAEIPMQGYDDITAPDSPFYWSILLRAESGRTLDVHAVYLDFSRVSTRRSYHLYYSVGTDWDNPVHLDSPLPGTNAVDYQFERRHSVVGATNLTAIEFRWYSGGNRIEYDNITIVGEIQGETSEEQRPSTAASNLYFTDVGAADMTLHWTSGDGARRLVVMREGSSIDSLPADTFDYTANALFGAGSELGSGNFVVYRGAGDQVTVTGLTEGALYHVAVFEFNGTGLSTSYKTDEYPSAAQRALGEMQYFTLTADGLVGQDFAALPSDFLVSGGSPLFRYGNFGQALDMADYSVTSSNALHHMSMTVGDLTYGTNGTGGRIDFRMIGTSTPSVDIDSAGTITLAEVRTRASGGGTGTAPAGSVTLHAQNGVVIAGDIDAAHATGGSAGGDISITVADGPLGIGGTVNNAGRSGIVTLSGASVAVGDIVSHHGNASLAGDSVTIASTTGGVEVGNITAYAIDGRCDVQITARGGDLVVGALDLRATGATGRGANLRGGAVSFMAPGSITMGAVTATVARGVSTSVRYDEGGAITVFAGGAIQITGGLYTYVNNTHTNSTSRSRGGAVHLVSTNGPIVVEGGIDAGAPEGLEAAGDLSLTAERGSITLYALDVNRLGVISLAASTNEGIIVTGPLAGLEGDVADNGRIDRFASVCGDVYYDETLGSNAYLAGGTYEISGSVGGPYFLRPLSDKSDDPPPAVPDIGRIERASNGAIGARFTSQSGVTYALSYTTNLAARPAHWLRGSTILGTGGEIEIFDDNPSDPMRVYRIELD